MTDLEYRNVVVRFGRGQHATTAVDGVTLDIPAGKIIGLVGESGCGKSTMAAAAVGLCRITSGQILVDGVDVTHARGKLARTRRRVQVVFQDPTSSLDPRMTIGESITEAIPKGSAGIRRLSPTAYGARRVAHRHEVARLLELVHLDPGLARSLPRQLSGGMLQRIAIARALATQPKIIIADEITSALDASVQGSVLNLIRDLRRELNIGFLLISHNIAVVRYTSDSIAVMSNGKVVEMGAAHDVIDHPQQAFTKQLLDAVPRLSLPQPTVLE